jgi:hypothetical protein
VKKIVGIMESGNLNCYFISTEDLSAQAQSGEVMAHNTRAALMSIHRITSLLRGAIIAPPPSAVL